MTGTTIDWPRVGQRIKRQMASHELSAEQVAKAVGVYRTTVYKWLAGDRITVDNLEKLAVVLKLPLPLLLFGEEVGAVREAALTEALRTTLAVAKEVFAEAGLELSADIEAELVVQLLAEVQQRGLQGDELRAEAGRTARLARALLERLRPRDVAVLA